jgi:predicted O-methyltransferase YrrM
MKQHLWDIIDETASELELHDLLYALIRMLKPNIVVETGAYLGHATVAMGKAVCENKKGRVISCDTNHEHVIEARLKTKNLPVVVNECSSLDLPQLTEADFIFSDSDYAIRSTEIGRAKRGAIILVHDTRISYNSDIPPLSGLVESLGGICFETYRGFGLLKRK